MLVTFMTVTTVLVLFGLSTSSRGRPVLRKVVGKVIDNTPDQFDRR